MMTLEILTDLGLVELPIFGDEELALEWDAFFCIWFTGDVRTFPMFS